MDKDQIIQLRNHHLKQGRNNDRRPIYPITKAECIIGGAGGGVEKVDTLPEKGEEGKIYYNTNDKKYYTYTNKDGFDEIGSGVDGPIYQIKYQYSPCFTNVAPIDLQPEGVDYFDELSFLKVGTKIDSYFFRDKEDDNMVFDFENSYSGEANCTMLHSALEQDFANYLTTLGIDWYNVDKTTISDIKYNTIIDLFDYKDLYKMGLTDIANAWLISKYIVAVEVSPDTDKESGYRIKINGVITSTEIINKGTIICPELHIKYIMQPTPISINLDNNNTGSVSSIDNLLRVNACNLAIDTLGASIGMVNESLEATGPSEIHELGTTGFAFYYKEGKRGPLPIYSLTINTGVDGLSSVISIFLAIPLFDLLNIVGRFYTGGANISIILPTFITPGEGNLDTEANVLYEYHIMNGVFTLIPLIKD